MPLPIEEYGLIGDLQSAAIVGSNGSIDWLCLPRFDSAACFAALLGTEENGHWRIAPREPVLRTTRHYRGPTLVLETEFQTAGGAVRLIDCMPVRERYPRVVRLVEGIWGTVPMTMSLQVRFDYGQVSPWVQRTDGRITGLAGPEALEISFDVTSESPTWTSSSAGVVDFEIKEGQVARFVLSWHPSYEAAEAPGDASKLVADTEAWWRDWAGRCSYHGDWSDDVLRSLLTLKGLIYEPTGGIVAAPTTSLPEWLGGVRNWDYRFCWVRDASLTLNALISGGYVDEAQAWRDWLLRAIAGRPDDVQIMYGVAGERRLDEYELDWLTGYEGSRPVHVGNAASEQLQLDVYGEALDAVYEARRLGMPQVRNWGMEDRLFDWLESHWRDADDGIWEVRGPRRNFVHSKVMAWVAADRAIKLMEINGTEGQIDRLKRVRSEIHDEVCREGFDTERNSFTQYYGSTQLDASLLLIPAMGFLPASDPRVIGTVEAIQRELVDRGLVMRYIPDKDAADGLPPGEGAFLPCSFWLVDALALIGRHDEASRLFEHLRTLRNDLGLFSEEYDQEHNRMIGNFPQAFTHLAFISSAQTLQRTGAAIRHAA